MASAPDLSPQALGALIAHPRFAEAARALYRSKVTTAAEDKVMAGLFRDAGHYVAALWAFSLHRDAGLTLPHLKAACAGSKMMSPGRAPALLGFLQHLGYVSRLSPRQGKAAAVYAPTPRFVDAWCRHMRSGLEAAIRLMPEAADCVALMDDPDKALGFARAQGDILLAAISHQGEAMHELPFVRIFQHRLGGGRALNLLLSRDAGEAGLAVAPMPFALNEVAAQSGILRIQAKRLFDDAQAAGLVRIEDGRLTVLEGAHTFLVYSTAFELAALLGAAEISLRHAA